MDKRKNIMVIDLRNQVDKELIGFTKLLMTKKINWIWLNELTQNYECHHEGGCNCCDGVANLKRRIKLKLRQDKETKKEDNVCPQCGGAGVMGNEYANADCDNCLGSGKI